MPSNGDFVAHQFRRDASRARQHTTISSVIRPLRAKCICETLSSPDRAASSRRLRSILPEVAGSSRCRYDRYHCRSRSEASLQSSFLWLETHIIPFGFCAIGSPQRHHWRK